MSGSVWGRWPQTSVETSEGNRPEVRGGQLSDDPLDVDQSLVVALDGDQFLQVKQTDVLVLVKDDNIRKYWF